MTKRPKPPLPQLFAVTNRSAAGTQLETAITLWFEEKDAASIHTLAVAAQGILNQMCKDRGIQASQVNALIESKPPAIRKRMRSAQNLFKHGRHEVRQWKRFSLLIPEFTELVMIDCASMYQRLFDTLSPLMLLFALRYSLFNPDAFPIKVETKGIEIENLRGFTRHEFLKKVFPRFRGKAASLRPPFHSGSPLE
jgi:hypothetical protein